MQTAGDTIKLEFSPLSLHFTFFPPSSVWKIKVITVTFIKLRKQDHLSLECCSESIPWVPSRTYPRLLPTRPFDARTWRQLWGRGALEGGQGVRERVTPPGMLPGVVPGPGHFPRPHPPHLDPSAGRRKDSVDVRLQAAPASAGCCNKRRSMGVSTTERCPLTALEAGCPGSSSRPATSPGLSPGLAHTASSPCRRRLFSLCVPTPSFYELRGHTQLRPTPMTSF